MFKYFFSVIVLFLWEICIYLLAFDETLERLADYPAIKPSEKKALLDHIEKSIQHQFHNMQINFKKKIDEKLNSNVLNNGNHILSCTSTLLLMILREQVKTQADKQETTR